MVQEVFIDRHLGAIDGQRRDVPAIQDRRGCGRLIGRALAQEHDVGDDRRALVLERVGGQADGSQEVRPLGQVFADGGVLLVEGEMAGDHGEHAAGL